MSTADKVLRELEKYELTKVGANDYRSNSPFRPGSNSHAFAVKIEGPEHGTYFDHASETEESGSLYQLATKLGIPLPTDTTTKRQYTSIDDYAAAHHVAGDVFRRAGWKEGKHQRRPCLIFPTKTGNRYRFTDGDENKTAYTSPSGYIRCWYGLERAVYLAHTHNQPLVICNGEASTVVAQYYGIAACCVTNGEKGTLPTELLEELKTTIETLNLAILVAFDCDKKGRKAGPELAAFLRQNGFNATAINLQGQYEGYDLADFVGAYRHDAAIVLLECPLLSIGDVLPPFDNFLAPPPPPDFGGSLNPPPPPNTPVGKSSGNADLLRFEATDEGNAEAVWSLHSHRFRHVIKWGWLHYTGTHWATEGAHAALEFAVVTTLRERRAAAVHASYESIVKCAKPDQARVRACISALQKHGDANVQDFDQSPHLLNVANGVINLRTGELIPHSEVEEQFTYCLATPYDPNTDYTPWLDFLCQVVGGGDEVISWLQEAVGYSITGETREECLFYIYGPSRSGKGTFTETLQNLLGSPLAVEMDFNTFTAQTNNPDTQNFALAPLKPSRMVFASESGKYQTLNEPKLKAMTGGNPIHCAFKGKDMFSYKPQFKIWLSSNEKPKADVDDDAIWGRFRVIQFPHSHLGNEDKTLKTRMSNPAILQGVLTWAVEGARFWYATPQGLTTPQAVKQAGQASRDELDTIQQWLDECTQKDPQGWVGNTILYNSYENWCKENGQKPRNNVNLGKALSAKGYMAGDSQRINGVKSRTRLGLVLVDKRQPPPQSSDSNEIDF